LVATFWALFEDIQLIPVGSLVVRSASTVLTACAKWLGCRQSAVIFGGESNNSPEIKLELEDLVDMGDMVDMEDTASAAWALLVEEHWQAPISVREVFIPLPYFELIPTNHLSSYS